MKCLVAACVVIAGLAPGPATGAEAGAEAGEAVYQATAGFLAQVFGPRVPKPKVLWLRGPARGVMKEILGHPYRGARVRYWARDRRTAWILEEIGKYKPITVGIAITDGRIERVEVLVYRESHGWEVRYPFFTNQFKDVRLAGKRELSRGIDGISGATLSVNAVTRLATLALYLDRRVVAE